MDLARRSNVRCGKTTALYSDIAANSEAERQLRRLMGINNNVAQASGSGAVSEEVV